MANSNKYLTFLSLLLLIYIMSENNNQSIIDESKAFIVNLQKVNELLNQESESFERIKGLMLESPQLDEKLSKKVESISTANLALREQFDIVSHIGMIVSLNIAEQKKIINRLKKKNVIDDKTEKRLMFRLLLFSESIQKALALTHQLTERNHEIVFLDHKLDAYKDLLHKGLENIKNIIRGHNSSAVGGRSPGAVGNDIGSVKKRLVESIKIAATGNREVLKRLCSEVKAESNAMKGIINEKAPETSYMKDFQEAARLYYDDSTKVKELVERKSSLFAQNLENIAELAVTLSLEIVEYLKIQESVDAIIQESSNDPEKRSLSTELKIIVAIACSNVENLIELNQYMVELSDLNAKREEQIRDFIHSNVELAGKLYHEAEALKRIIDFLIDSLRKCVESGIALDRYVKNI